MRSRPALDLFVISWLVLFFELACIRWFPAHVVFLSFFTNTVLLACFVGMSIGCMTARRPTRLIQGTPFRLAVALVAGLVFDIYSHKLLYVLTAADQTESAEVVFFGSETNAKANRNYHVPVELVAALFFALIAAAMAGLGQEMGRAFNRVANRTTAYSVNLLGSLVGILAFAGLSDLQLPPAVWFAVTAVGIAYYALRRDPDAPPDAAPSRPRHAIATVICLAVALLMTLPTSGLGVGFKGREMHTTWSPYYRIDWYPQNMMVDTNRISHQRIIPRDLPYVDGGYALPYLLAHDTPLGDPKHEKIAPFKRVLIIGAGSGNDLSRAVKWCQGPDVEIDAVDIDPVIQDIGITKNPDQPYQDPRVHRYVTDGRNFLRNAPDKQYDLVVFALIDSLILHSGFSNIRLENYLFTVESFQEVRRVLKPTGMFAMYNFFRQGWLVARLRDMLRGVFGCDPVALTIPPKAKVEMAPDYQAFTAFYSGSPEVVDPLRRAFDEAGGYWITLRRPAALDSPNGFQNAEPKGLPPLSPELQSLPTAANPEWGQLLRAKIEESNGTLRPATDDWPFLYVRHPMIPEHTWRGVGLIAIMSLVLWLGFGGHRGLFGNNSADPSASNGATASRAELGLFARSFFLGAGFMLVETKAVVQMALLFGGTWKVNTIVFAAVLMMALAGNLFAGWLKPRRLEIYYVGLFLALLAGILIPLGAFLGLDRTTQIVGACTLVFLPVAFAGVVFATSFRRTTKPDVMFGANVAGALLGGLAENSSMLLGFQYLLCVAAGFYVLSALFGNRSTESGQPAVSSRQQAAGSGQ